MPEVTALPKPAASTSQWTRQNPFPGKLLVNRRLSSGDSEKDTRHFEVDLTGWSLSFQPGDSVAVYPTNDPTLVDAIVHALGAKGDEPVTAAKMQRPLREALLRDFSITQPTPRFLKAIVERASAAPML
jgi:sulfite reductase (NADPH) flavoprotein alpha-component